MSDEFKNINSAGEEAGQDDQEIRKEKPENEERQENAFVMREASASREEETSQRETGDQEPGKAPTEENPRYAHSYRREPQKEEWYEKEKKAEYGSYRFSPQVPLEPAKKKKERASGGMGKKAGLVVGAAVLFGVVAGVVFQAVNYTADQLFPKETKQIENTTTTGGATTVSSQSGESGDVAEVAKNVMPSIVSITGVSLQEIPNYFSYFGLGSPETEEIQSNGSGIIVGQNDTELLIATNNHVVADADSLTVCFTNQDGTAASTSGLEQTAATRETDNSVDTEAGTAVSALVKGTDSDNDLAVVAVKLKDIPEDVLNNIKVATIGDSESLVIGEQVVAIGNALGYGQSVTSGYVSALNKKVSSENANSTFIQTDAAINPGNSGGALLNMKGELIGINSAKIASDEVEGMGFAIPISTAQPILDNLMSKETREKVEDADKAAYLGVVCKDVSSEAEQMYNIPVGVFVDSVEENGPADKAGIQSGDIIRKIDGTSVETSENLISQLEYYKAGEKIDFVISRADGGEYKEKTITIELGAKKDSTTASGAQKER